jgi:CPA2 family monovalent cation:H+ antiporter-2
MQHNTPLIGMLVGGFVFAYLCGMLAVRLRMPPLIGYLLAGIIVGPFTPGFVADQSLAPELAEIGVILLMFGVGLHFSLKDLLSVKTIAIPGAIVQIGIATLMGMALADMLGWPAGAGFLFGLSLSVASTVVLLTALQEKHLIETPQGRIAIGWLIVEDLVMVLALVLIPALSTLLRGDATANLSGITLLWVLALTAGKVIAFIAVMLVVGRRVIPWLLERTVRTGSRELFRLAILALALGVAFGASNVFGVSFALGAFFAGMILGESELSHRAAEESLPLRDAFSVLFFVSVGMLFNPKILFAAPMALFATFLIISIGKSIAAYIIVMLFRYPIGTGLTVAASLAQIGEFSFILATLGVSMGILPEMAKDLILAGAILSILFNPIAFYGIRLLEPLLKKLQGIFRQAPEEESVALVPSTLTQHAILVGFGRVGKLVAEELEKKGTPFIVIDIDSEQCDLLRERAITAICGNAVSAELLKAANLPAANWLLLAIVDPLESGQIIALSRSYQPDLKIIARAHTDIAIAHLKEQGADHIITGDYPVALGMTEYIPS